MLRWGKVEVTGGFLLTAAFLFYLDVDGLLPMAALAALWHEAGHYAAVRLLGGEVERFRLTSVGGDMTLSKRRGLSYGRELLAILAGPLANLALALCLARGAGGRSWAYLLAGLNLSLGVFNLLPVYPLDGGRALTLALGAVLPPRWASRGTRGLSVLTIGVLLALGTTLGVRWGSFTLLFMALWLMTGLILNERRENC